MVVTDPSIDPITGLPVLNPSGPVQQIPLGQEVFPYADLNATAQPTRGPIYGDDIIPTSGLVTAPDVQMKPRSIQSTTTRELRVREAVFQNLGAAIPDGATAPVDVNVVHGGGGGGGMPTPTVVSSAEMRTSVVNDDQWTRAANWRFMTTVYAMDIYLELTNTPSSSVNNHNFFGFTDADGVDTLWYAFIVAVGTSPSGVGAGTPYALEHFDFDGGLNIATYLGRPLADGVWVHMNNKQAPVYAAVTLYGD